MNTSPTRIFHHRGINRAISLALVLLLLMLNLCFAPSSLAQQSVPDYGFLDTLKLPWRSGDREPRLLTQDWIGHWAVGFALDFGHISGGEYIRGTDVLAPMGGSVTKGTDSGTGYGNWVKIDAGNGWQVLLAHLAEPSSAGSLVQTGQVVGHVGSSGTTAAHIHVEVRLNNQMPNANQISRIFGHPRDDFLYAPGKTFTSTNSDSSCPAPTFNSPDAGQTFADQRITFSWQALSCGQGYTFRIKNITNMDSGGTTIVDTGEGGTSRTETIPMQWNNQDLYWGVRAANASSAIWAVRRFRIEPPINNCIPNADQVALYIDANFSGQCVTLGYGNYPDSGALNMANDSISSVRVGSNVKLTLCRDADYSGVCDTFTGDDTYLGDNQIGNDQVTSAKIEHRPTSEPCPGPALNGSSNDANLTSPSVSFSWNPPSGCTFSGYTFRVKDTSDMEFGGSIIFDEGQGETSVVKNIPAEWQNRDLYWGVRTANPLSPNWSVRHFRVAPPGETDPQAVTSGQRIDAQIDPANDDDTFTFDAAVGQAATIVMERTDSSNLDSYLELYGPGGLVGYDDDSAGNYNSRLVKTLPQSGSYRIVAHSYNHASSGTYRLSFDLSAAPSSGDGDDGRWISFGGSLQGTISPNSDRDTYYFNAVSGRTISLRMTKQSSGLDSYLELYDPNGAKIAENDDSGGDYNAWIVANVSIAGAYRIVARSYNGSSGGVYTLALEAISGNNLARGRTAYASSIENNDANLIATNATDGNLSTRWSSVFQDYQWFYVDLGQDRSINQVVLRWETAYADQYDIDVWDAARSQWQAVFSTNSGDGNVDTITFAPTTTRYVMLWARHRYAHYGWLQFGFSLWEFEVYNTLSALVPTVPPDNTNKPAETLVPLVPLPPDPDGKIPSLLSQGTAQENMPSSTSDSTATAPAVAPGEVYGPPMTGLRLSADRVFVGHDQITLTAVDTHDADQQGRDIVAYRWKSDLDGVLGDRAVVTLNASKLSPGRHTITLEVQDNEGNWSEPVSATLDVLTDSIISGQVYLPLIVR